MTRPLLACRGVGVRHGDRRLVDDLDLDVAAGERWAVVGPNGAGKSTLLLVLAGARRADAGRVELDGREISAWSVEELAALRAMVADRWIDPFSMNALESVEAARYRMEFRERRRPGADGDADRNGSSNGSGAGHGRAVARRCLEAMDGAALAGRDIRRLSRGERQRVALAAALAQEAALVLLDEPISHQDPRHQLLVLEHLKACAGTTFIGALHDINAAARFATHALLLDGDGRWRAGPAAQVLNCGSLSALFSVDIVEVEVGGHRVFVTAAEEVI
jgi:iron complex transport system ATP-binding protein